MNAVDAASGACDGLYSGPVFAAPATVRATQCQRAQTQYVALAAEWLQSIDFTLLTSTNVLYFNTPLSVQAIESTDNSNPEQMKLDESVSSRVGTTNLCLCRNVTRFFLTEKFPDWRLLTYLLSAERHPLWL